jgi:phage recombination protein Bet
MTTTTTATDTADQTDLLGDAQRAAEHAEASSLAVIRPEQQRFDENQRAILRQLGIEDATDGDLDLFFHVCRTTGLDPFRKQIYMIGRNTKVSEWVDTANGGRRKEERYVTKYTIQTGIDGYRRNVREAAKTLGDDLRFDGPWFTAEDDFHITEDGEVIQHWRKVWPKKGHPHAARFVVIRNGEEFEGVAHYDEFVQTNYNGEPNSMWAKMPRNQIAKCAEALAYRRAYPDDLSGLILEDAAQPTIIDGDTGKVIREGRPAQRPQRSAPVTIDEILAEEVPVPEPEAEPEPKKKRERPSGTRTRGDKREPKPDPVYDEPVYAEVVDEPAAEPEPAPVEPDLEPPHPNPAADEADPERGKLIRRLFALLGSADVTDREDRLVIYRKALKRPEISSTNDLPDDDLRYVISGLDAHDKKGDLAVWAEATLIAAVEEETAAAQAAASTTEEEK